MLTSRRSLMADDGRDIGSVLFPTQDLDSHRVTVFDACLVRSTAPASGT